ncbi:hypothetical protein E2C01_009240 [Portunus trituberculatus]|uniref:Uncharacterized protein n=1 Tax=Portunus trituberculatus TaxID=210409 RepID=A0A5B7D5E3_PORTR|nr:hypothetical protein [Portunus trituberculatus]
MLQGNRHSRKGHKRICLTAPHFSLSHSLRVLNITVTFLPSSLLAVIPASPAPRSSLSHLAELREPTVAESRCKSSTLRLKQALVAKFGKSRQAGELECLAEVMPSPLTLWYVL